MQELCLELYIDARPEACFALLRDPRLHSETVVVHEGEFAFGQRVRFESRTFGVRQVLVVEVTDFDPPHRLTDTMIAGRFLEFRHTHEFTEHNGGTLMRDVVAWRSPFGPLGRLANALFLHRKLTKLITGRNRRLKALAESAV
jgi:ligand-binding SRPBCC domain-containing protein